MCNNKNKQSGGVSCSACNAFIFTTEIMGWTSGFLEKNLETSSADAFEMTCRRKTDTDNR